MFVTVKQKVRQEKIKEYVVLQFGVIWSEVSDPKWQ